ncbi:hypothetical protein C8Q77DRAFT_1063042 [Trametes polyzona]|nr:hypothetical protein C8Q77DRAFT_1063042 [Trametes polyzona]
MEAPPVPPKHPNGPPVCVAVIAVGPVVVRVLIRRGQPNSLPNELPPPPPYSPPASSTSAAGPSSFRPAPPPVQRTTSTIFQPQNAQTVNHFELFSKHTAISGTYLVDPLLPIPGQGSSRKLRRSKKSKRAWGKEAQAAQVNACFRTRHGALNLDVAVVADPSRAAPLAEGQKIPACVVVESRHGRVNVNLSEVQPGRSIDLQVESCHGKIVLLLPPTFDGPIKFNTRNPGAISFLPAFAARTRTLRASDRETLVICTAPDDPARPKPPATATPTAQATGDRALVCTKHGRIIVGVSGIDRVEEAQPAGGLLSRLGDLLDLGGRALGQYVEAHASKIERKLTERSVVVSQWVDAKVASTTTTSATATVRRA